MATWNDVRRLALALPETTETTMWGNFAWKVKDKLFVWERPLRRPDLKALGDSAPDGEILGARVDHIGARDVLIHAEPGLFFTTPHFDDYPAVLVQLDKISVEELEEVVVDAWFARAPKRLAARQAERMAAE